MKPNSTLSALFGLAVLAALGYALWYLGRWGLGVIGGVSPAVQAGAAAALTLLVCASIVANGLHAIARREDARQQRAARAAAYDGFFRRHGGGAESGFAIRGGMLPLDGSAAHQQMLLHASPAVLGAYLRLLRAEEAGGGQEELVELVRAMRRDLGQRSPDVGVAELAELLDPPARAPVRAGNGGVLAG
ncbi:MAG TPA: hypothetical protein VFR37_16705 [Longimicrobium sp.]|nr:hypothetical protein [Longimicrobium sp.]